MMKSAKLKTLIALLISAVCFISCASILLSINFSPVVADYNDAGFITHNTTGAIGGVSATDIVGNPNYNGNTLGTYYAGYVAQGATNIVKGNADSASFQGSSYTTWGQAARINYGGQLNSSFRIKDGETVSFSFMINQTDTDVLSVGPWIDNQNWNQDVFFLIVRDGVNSNEIMRLKITLDTSTEAGGDHIAASWPDRPTEVYHTFTNNVSTVSQYNPTNPLWTVGNGSFTQDIVYQPSGGNSVTFDNDVYHYNEFSFSFNKTDLLMGRVFTSDTSVKDKVMQPYVKNEGNANTEGTGAYFHKIIQQKLTANNTEFLCFDVLGYNGWTDDVQIIVTEINGQRLDNNGTSFTKNVTPDLSGVWVENSVIYNVNDTVTFGGSAKDVLTDVRKYMYNETTYISDENRYTYKITSDKGITYTNGTKKLVLTEAGKHTLTVSVTDKQGGTNTRNFTVYAFDLNTFGSEIRMTDEGLRIRSSVSKTLHAELKADDPNMVMGTLIIPSAVLGQNELTIDDLGANVVNVKNSKWSSNVASYRPNEFSAVLRGIPSGNNLTEIQARAYITFIDANGKKQTVYGNVYKTSVNDAAQNMLDDVSNTQTSIYKYNVNINGRKVWSPYNAAQILLIKNMIIG